MKKEIKTEMGKEIKVGRGRNASKCEESEGETESGREGGKQGGGGRKGGGTDEKGPEGGRQRASGRAVSDAAFRMLLGMEKFLLGIFSDASSF